MEKQLKKNRNLILLIFAMGVIPFCIAWYLVINPQILTSRTNRGDLIIPVITTERTDLTAFDQFSADNIKELPGHWLMINVIPGKHCNEICTQAIYKSRQLRLMLNKDLIRTRRIVVLMDEVSATVAASWWENDARLLRMTPSASLRKSLKSIDNGNIADGELFLMDPLGNLMMRYKSGFDPYDVKKDLHKLLKVSQIG